MGMTLAWIVRGIAVLIIVLLLDRLLLWIEARGWMNYRRHGLSRGAATYHLLELQAIFDPGMQQVIEVQYEQKKKQSDSGAPPGT